MRQETNQVQVEVRSAPKYVAFAVAGVIVGVIVAGVLATIAAWTPSEADAATTVRRIAPLQAFGLLALALGAAGAAVALAVALVADRVLSRRARTALAEHEVVSADEPDVNRSGAESHSDATIETSRTTAGASSTASTDAATQDKE